jgi:hypothetical protein
MTVLPEDLFTQIYRRAPTEQDRTRLTGVKAGLGLSSRDELWPMIMVLDHYDKTIRAGRAATVKEVQRVLDELRDVPGRAGPIASAAAQNSVERIIEEASDKIARASMQKSITTADRISRRQLIVVAIAGALLAVGVAAAAGWGMYLVLEARGLCAEPPGATFEGDIACIVQRL